MLAIVLALGSSIAWGTADFFGGAVSRRLPVLSVTLISQAAGLAGLLVVFAAQGGSFDEGSLGIGLVSGLCGGLGLLAFYRALALGLRPPVEGPPARWLPVAGIGLLDVSANGLFALASTRGLLAVASVLGSLYPVTTVLLAHVVLGERVSTVQRTGVAIALVGVAVISAG